MEAIDLDALLDNEIERSYACKTARSAPGEKSRGDGACNTDAPLTNAPNVEARMAKKEPNRYSCKVNIELADIPLESGEVLKASLVGSDLQLSSDAFSAIIPEDYLPSFYRVVAQACAGPRAVSVADWGKRRVQKQAEVTAVLNQLRKSVNLMGTGLDVEGAKRIINETAVVVLQCALAAKAGCQVDERLTIDCSSVVMEALREILEFLIKATSRPAFPQ